MNDKNQNSGNRQRIHGIVIFLEEKCHKKNRYSEPT
jgi:hypothetical protein